jgi:hypothetical protein
MKTVITANTRTETGDEPRRKRASHRRLISPSQSSRFRERRPSRFRVALLARELRLRASSFFGNQRSLAAKSSRIQASVVRLDAYYVRDIAPDERPKGNRPSETPATDRPHLAICRKDHGRPRSDCDGVTASMNEARFALADCLRRSVPATARVRLPDAGLGSNSRDKRQADRLQSRTLARARDQSITPSGLLWQRFGPAGRSSDVVRINIFTSSSRLQCDFSRSASS